MIRCYKKTKNLCLSARVELVYKPSKHQITIKRLFLGNAGSRRGLQHSRNVMIYVRHLFNEVGECVRVLKLTVGA